MKTFAVKDKTVDMKIVMELVKFASDGGHIYSGANYFQITQNIKIKHYDFNNWKKFSWHSDIKENHTLHFFRLPNDMDLLIKVYKSSDKTEFEFLVKITHLFARYIEGRIVRM
jgi:hypothetical protein